MIKLENVSKSYDDGASFAVRDINLEIAEGELLALLGESGCGKTTTLKTINRLIPLTSGQISINQRDIMSLNPVTLRREIGYVIQGIGLFPHMTVAENVAVVPNLLGWNKDRIKARVDELLNLVGLPTSEFGFRRPSSLSGGQQQRVGVARALAAGAKTMLMDEPFGALDPITRDELQQEFNSLKTELNLTVVLVTHDIVEALLFADRIAVMRNGRIVSVGTPHEMIAKSSDLYVKTLMQSPRRQIEKLEHLISREELN